MESSEVENGGKERWGEIMQHWVDEGCQSYASHCVYLSCSILSCPILYCPHPYHVWVTEWLFPSRIIYDFSSSFSSQSVSSDLHIAVTVTYLRPPCRYLPLPLSPSLSPSVTATSFNLISFLQPTSPRFSCPVLPCPTALDSLMLPLRTLSFSLLILVMNIDTHTHTHTHTHDSTTLLLMD